MIGAILAVFTICYLVGLVNQLRVNRQWLKSDLERMRREERYEVRNTVLWNESRERLSVEKAGARWDEVLSREIWRLADKAKMSVIEKHDFEAAAKIRDALKVFRVASEDLADKIEEALEAGKECK